MQNHETYVINYNWKNVGSQINLSTVSTRQRSVSSDQLELIRTLTKYLFLVLFAAFSTIIGAMVLSLYIIDSNVYNFDTNYIICNFTYNTIIEIDCAINILSLYLQFPFNSAIYHKLFSKCHTKMEIYFTKTISQSNQRELTAASTSKSQIPIQIIN